MKTILHKNQSVFFAVLLTFFMCTLSSCTDECVGNNAKITFSNDWNRSIHVEIYSGGYITHNASLDEGERISFTVNVNEIEVRTREKGFLLFPDRENATIDATGCWNYEVFAYTDPNNSERHYLETNHVPR